MFMLLPSPQLESIGFISLCSAFLDWQSQIEKAERS